uniref:Uncharacterized protein n=1 Tax=Anopheles albimanus TaxID=7167 RepID=A0A182FZG1_ANOAL
MLSWRRTPQAGIGRTGLRERTSESDKEEGKTGEWNQMWNKRSFLERLPILSLQQYVSLFTVKVHVATLSHSDPYTTGPTRL